MPWHLLGVATVIGTGTAGVVTEDAPPRVSHGNWLAESNKSIRGDESSTQEAALLWKTLSYFVSLFAIETFAGISPFVIENVHKCSFDPLFSASKALPGRAPPTRRKFHDRKQEIF